MKSLANVMILVFGLLFVVIVGNAVFSTWQWNQFASQRSKKDLENKMTIVHFTLLNELDKFQYISSIIREQNIKFAEFLEYDNYNAIYVMLQNISVFYHLDLLLMFNEDEIAVSNKFIIESESSPDTIYETLLHYPEGKIGIEKIPVELFKLQSFSPLPTTNPLCIKTVIPLYYAVGEIAGQVVVLKTINGYQELADKMKKFSGAEIVIYDQNKQPVLSTFEEKEITFPTDQTFSHQEKSYFVKIKRLTDIAEQPVGYLVVALDSSASQQQRIQLLITNLLPFIATVVVFIFLVFLLNKRILKSMMQWSIVLHRVTEGDLHVRLDIPKKPRGKSDEIENMGMDFNIMMERLEKSYDQLDQAHQDLEDLNGNLENKVQEQTLIIRKKQQELEMTNRAYEYFVPKTFLALLNKKSIIDINLGDNVKKKMSVLFSDIRSFTTISENMNPEENFNFLNSYLQQMGPVIRKHHGFIDKYIGDAIMALFQGKADDAIDAGVDMLQNLRKYNERRLKAGYLPVDIGIGINTGDLMLGTIGEHGRMDGTVISDAVNLAARIEGLTKMYKSQLLVSENTINNLEKTTPYSIRVIDLVRVKGKTESVRIFEIFDGDLPEIRDAKLAVSNIYDEAISYYYSRKFEEAQNLFQKCLDRFPDKASQIYIERCQYFLKVGVDEKWDGVTQLNTK